LLAKARRALARRVHRACEKTPDKLVIGTNPAGSLPHITAKLFVDLTKTAITVVPYATGGTADAIRDILGGRVHAVIDGWPACAAASSRRTSSAGDHVAQSDRSASRSAGRNRDGSRPHLDRLQALTVAPGTPEPIVRFVTDSLRKVLEDPALQKRLQETGPEFSTASSALS